ncbi:hypothetical protein [Corynebacterium coyleae]|nr:hypothetical protein [Corynebacterium coyleae]
MRPDGDNTGAGIINQLGRSQYGEFTVLIREAVQNSWDARDNDRDVSVRFSLTTLGKSASVWREFVGTSSLPDPTRSILESIDADSPVLVISDRGTVGLGGPIRSDEPIPKAVKPNFVQFLRNVGEPRDTALGGGTFGYGKATFFRVSRAAAVLVDSKSLDNDECSRRLMGAALTAPFADQSGKRFTGRHWWGTINDQIPDPLIGQDAERVAADLGMPGFDSNETGTDIVVLLPRLKLESEKETLESLAERLRGHIYWHLWPKFETLHRSRGIKFTVSVDGKELEMPHPSEIPILRDYVKALDEIAEGRGVKYRLKKHGTTDLGELAIQHSIPDLPRSVRAVTTSILQYCPFELDKPVCHIARMRQAELVVDYVASTPLQSDRVGYVGVFRATASSDEAFANAEPPAHDSWVTSGLTGSDLGMVRGANAFIRKQCESFATSHGLARSQMVEGLGRVSNELGGLLPAGSGTRADSSGKLSRSSSVGSKVKGRQKWKQTCSRIVLEENVPVIEARLEISMPPPAELSLLAECHILLANRQKEDPKKAPLGTKPPRFLGWFLPGQAEPVETAQMLSDIKKMGSEMIVRFEFLPDTASRVVVSEDV